MNMELRDIQYFKVVAQHCNIGRAAEVLGLSPTALSKSLRRLEHSLGAKLVKRVSRGVELTVVGAAIAARADILQVTADDLIREAADLNSGAKGSIRAGVAPGLTEITLAHAYIALLMETKDIALDVHVLDGPALRSALRRGEVDLIFSTPPDGRAAPQGFEIVDLYRERWVVGAAADHPLARRKRVTIDALLDEVWVLNRHGIALSEFFTKVERQGLPQPKVLLQANSWDILFRTVASSRLLSFGSHTALMQARRQHSLVALPVEGLKLERRVVVYYRKDGYLPPAAMRLIEILKAQGRALGSQHPE
jgi:DNA-binding transcriptional LysR family regulator